MPDFSIRNKCQINTNWDTDTFVGIHSIGSDISIHFPLGYHISDDDEGLRKDILLLFNVIKATTGKRNSEINASSRVYDFTAFPLQAYMAVIYDFYARGYYHVNEVLYSVQKRGKIDWNKTIKSQKPYVQNNTVYYLDFVTKRNQVNEDELITQIHEYLVYDSFEKIGWLFTNSMPKRPRIKYNERLFRRTLIKKISETFNDKNKRLFQSMLAIIDYKGNEDSKSEFRYGTYRFEYVWESLIDKVFGINDKDQFFPQTTWHLDSGCFENAKLEPDSIMIYGDDIYILDAKYYKFGATKRPSDLPGTSSVNKQITYGEYIYRETKFRERFGSSYKVYNAFLMPFDCKSLKWNDSKPIQYIGKASSDWKTGEKPFENVAGVLLDVKSLMQAWAIRSKDDEEFLAYTIRKSYE